MQTITNSMRAAELSQYIFDTGAAQAEMRFDGLSKVYDAWTIQHLEHTGVGAGWRCLDVGGGGGSIARWLGRRVGRSGHVLVTDLNPRFLTALDQENIEVRQHDIIVDELPESAFDLVHERLVLLHIPERERALQRMVRALKPGGWLVLEDYADLIDRSALTSDASIAPLLRKAYAALSQLLRAHGTDLSFARRRFPLLREYGLVESGMEGYLVQTTGGSPAARVYQANIEQIREEAVRTGLLCPADVDALLKLLVNPEFAEPIQPIMLTAWGRRPL